VLMTLMTTDSMLYDVDTVKTLAVRVFHLNNSWARVGSSWWNRPH